MALLIRILSNKSYHEPLEPDSAVGELAHVRGDAFKNFNTNNCRISIFRADSTEDVEEIVYAFAANREHVDKIDYCLADEVDFVDTNVEFESNDAALKHPVIKKKHSDVCGLNASVLSDFLFVWVKRGKCFRISRAKVKSYLSSCIESGRYKKEWCSDSFLKNLGC